jgi:uncharacterized protein (TIGR00369 family)
MMQALRFEPRTSDYETRCRASFAKQGLMTTYGARIVHVAPGQCDIACDFSEGLSQQHGFFHAGVTTALADTASGFAAFTLFEANAGVLTVEFKINLLAPAAGKTVIARGRVERAGKTITVCRSDVVVLQGDVEKAVATGLFTLMQVTSVRG